MHYLHYLYQTKKVHDVSKAATIFPIILSKLTGCIHLEYSLGHVRSGYIRLGKVITLSEVRPVSVYIPNTLNVQY